jgi:ketosteroid isomerase-like protein
MNKFTSTLAALLLLAGCNQKNDVDTQAEGEKLMQLSREWSAVASTGDIEKTLGYWADDAYVLSAGQPPLRGKESIRQMIVEGFNDPDFRISWEPQSAEISESGDMGYLIEDTQISMKDSTGAPMTQHFKAVTVWKKQSDGTWKNVVDVMSPVPAN